MAREGGKKGKKQPGLKPVVYIWVRFETSGSVENILNVSLALYRMVTWQNTSKIQEQSLQNEKAQPEKLSSTQRLYYINCINITHASCRRTSTSI
jgi:hypothetical protein